VANTALDLGSPVPLWEQLAAILREQIRRGELSGRIPSAKTIAQQYEVSTRTSERSLNALKAEGLVVAVVGKGFYTAPR
jgi:DNA-binding GntR family transcriptional regulator